MTTEADILEAVREGKCYLKTGTNAQGSQEKPGLY